MDDVAKAVGEDLVDKDLLHKLFLKGLLLQALLLEVLSQASSAKLKLVKVKAVLKALVRKVSGEKLYVELPLEPNQSKAAALEAESSELVCSEAVF